MSHSNIECSSLEPHSGGLPSLGLPYVGVTGRIRDESPQNPFLVCDMVVFAGLSR
jgi:hypothetical protein